MQCWHRMIAEATQIELELKDLAHISAVLESSEIAIAIQIELELEELTRVSAVLESNEVAEWTQME